MSSYSDEWYIEQGICPTCGGSICPECGHCVVDGYNVDCSYYIIKDVKE
jgi:hypothetical protein